MLVAHTWATSLSDNKQRKTQTEKKTKKWMMVLSLVWKQVGLECSAKSWRRLGFPQRLEEGHSRAWGHSWRKPYSRASFLVWFSSTFGIRRRDWEDDRRNRGGSWRGISSWRYCGTMPLKLFTPVIESCGQYDPSREASGVFFLFCLVFKTGLMCSLFFVSVTILTAVFCTSRRRRSSQPGSPHKHPLQ